MIRMIMIGAVALLGACAQQPPLIQTYRPPLGADCTIRGVPCTQAQRDRIASRAKAKPKPAPAADPLDAATADLRRQSLEVVEKMAASLGAIPESEEARTDLALDSVRRMLKDPSSAEFSDVRTVDYKSGKVVCGQVNAKNSYGGYVGAKPFVAGVVIAQIYESSPYPDLELAANAGLMDACY